MYTQKERDKLLEAVASGASLRATCSTEGMPSLSTVMRWQDEDEEFREQYARAVDMRARVKFEELDDVSEEAAGADSAVKVAGLRLKADNIKWQLARMHARYGDKLELGGTLKHDHTAGLSAETASLLASLKAGPDCPGDEAPVQN